MRIRRRSAPEPSEARGAVAIATRSSRIVRLVLKTGLACFARTHCVKVVIHKTISFIYYLLPNLFVIHYYLFTNLSPHILLCNASYAVGMLHGAMHRFIAQSAASSKFGDEFRLLSPSKLES